MKQERLNHLMLLHAHKELTDTLNLIDVANDFEFKCQQIECWNYLSSQLQQVAVNSSVSSTISVRSGVPQGSVLGLLLFIILYVTISGKTRHVAKSMNF